MIVMQTDETIVTGAFPDFYPSNIQETLTIAGCKKTTVTTDSFYLS
jgi:hypothetical protein